MEKFDLVRIDRPGFSLMAQDPLLSGGDMCSGSQNQDTFVAFFQPMSTSGAWTGVFHKVMSSSQQLEQPLPPFILVVLVTLPEGLGQRYGSGYEPSFVYHHAKKWWRRQC